MPVMFSVGITDSITILVSNGCWCNCRFHRLSFFLALLPSSLPNLSVSVLYLHMSLPFLQCLANGDLFIDILLIYLVLELNWLIDWHYILTESSSHCNVILFIWGLYRSHSIKTRKFYANLCRQATCKMTLCVFLRRPSSCLRRRVCFYVETNASG